jgi:hypothetical protein
MADDSRERAAATPLHRREVFRTARGIRLSNSRGRPVSLPERLASEAADAPEPFARRDYSEPND